MQTPLDTLIEALKIPHISESRKYWLVRAEGGDYYDDFVIGGYIAIRFNKIKPDEIQRVFDGDKPWSEHLKGVIQFHYPDDKRPGLSASYINLFYQGIKKGDIVAIPSEASAIISFGEVIDSTLYYEPWGNIETLDSEIMGSRNVCPYQIRRKVRWLRQIERDRLDLKFFKSLFAHNTISDLEDYSNVIDRMLCGIYLKNNELHYKLNITTEEDIPLLTYMQLTGSIVNLCKDFDEFGDARLKTDVSGLTVKMQAESPGFWELISLVSNNLELIPAVLLIGVLATGVFGGKFKASPISYETDGLVKKIMDWHAHLRAGKSSALDQYERALKILQDTPEDVREEMIASMKKDGLLGKNLKFHKINTPTPLPPKKEESEPQK